MPKPDRVEFYCNDLKEAGGKIFVRRAPFGTPDYRCGKVWHKYKKDNWTYQQTNETCGNGKPIWKMVKKSKP